jgi:hypothetical protein
MRKRGAARLINYSQVFRTLLYHYATCDLDLARIKFTRVIGEETGEARIERQTLSS